MIDTTARELVAIVVADIVGYSKLMSVDEIGTVEAMRAHRAELIDPLVRRYGGRIVKTTGDGLLIKYSSVLNAVQCAVDIQREMAHRETVLSEDRRIVFRFGVNIGDVIHTDGDIFGDGINVAARIEAMADPGGVFISRAVLDHISGKCDLLFEDIGRHSVKNIARPVHVYRVVLDPSALPEGRGNSFPQARKIKYSTPIALAIVVFAVLVMVAWIRPWAPSGDIVSPSVTAGMAADQPTIAVLAFDDLSNGKNNGYLSDAISEGIMTELSRFKEISVIARNSSFKYRGKATDVRLIGRELGVQYILEGSQQKEEQRLRVTAQLIDAASGTHIWAESYDRDLEDIFAMQTDIVRSITATVGLKLAYNPPPSGGLKKLSALRYHLEARTYIRKVTRDANEKARQLNLKAIEVDPNSPFGYIGMGFVYRAINRWGWAKDDGAAELSKATDYAQKALTIDPGNYSAHYLLGRIHMDAGEQNLAVAKYRRAIDLNPSATNVMLGLAQALVYKSRGDEAVALIEQAMKINPHYPQWYLWMHGWALWEVGKCEQALTAFQKMAKVPVVARKHLAVIFVCLGQQAKAEKTIRTLLSLQSNNSIKTERGGAGPKYENPADLKKWLNALRQAGLPEE